MLNEIILGIIQGITEWLPVSSSGHLVIAQHYLGIGENLALDIMLHIGTLLVVLWIFRKDILQIINSLIRFIKTRKFDKHSKLALYVVAGSIPTGLIGILLNDYIESAFSSLVAVGIALLITGTLLWSTRYAKKKGSLGVKESLIIGLAQGAAIFPGISRSGSTISTGLLLGVDRETAARYSFLLFIPAAVGALILQLDEFQAVDVSGMVAGTLAAMVVSYFVIDMLLKIVRKGKLYWFSYYCWLAGAIVIILSA